MDCSDETDVLGRPHAKPAAECCTGLMQYTSYNMGYKIMLCRCEHALFLHTLHSTSIALRALFLDTEAYGERLRTSAACWWEWQCSLRWGRSRSCNEMLVCIGSAGHTVCGADGTGRSLSWRGVPFRSRGDIAVTPATSCPCVTPCFAPLSAKHEHASAHLSS